MTRNQVYELMKRVGHSAAKALEIAIDYERGDKHAKQWVASLSTPRSTPQPKEP
jgi:hypothetical protein